MFGDAVPEASERDEIREEQRTEVTRVRIWNERPESGSADLGIGY